MRKLLEILGLLMLLIGAVALAKELNAQSVPQKDPSQSKATVPAATPDVKALIEKEFGDDFKLATDIGPMYGDFDRDGQPDVAVVATGGNPLMGEGLHGYKTLDPYNASFGYGNPKVTMGFNAHDTAARYVLIIHNWQKPDKKF